MTLPVVISSVSNKTKVENKSKTRKTFRNIKELNEMITEFNDSKLLYIQIWDDMKQLIFKNDKFMFIDSKKIFAVSTKTFFDY